MPATAAAWVTQKRSAHFIEIRPLVGHVGPQHAHLATELTEARVHLGAQLAEAPVHFSAEIAEPVVHLGAQLAAFLRQPPLETLVRHVEAMVDLAEGPILRIVLHLPHCRIIVRAEFCNQHQGIVLANHIRPSPSDLRRRRCHRR